MQCPFGLPPSLAQLRLHSITTQDDLTRCTSHKSHTPALEKCQTLLPAGTGTGTLASRLQRFHNHQLRIDGNRGGCYVMSLRDPAGRFASGVRDGSPLTRASLNLRHPGTADVPTANEFVAAVRNPSHPAHPAVMRLYWMSVAYPGGQDSRIDASLGVHGGNNHLISQVDFLRHLDCTRHEIHFVCLERFEDDFDHLLHTFGNHTRAERGKTASISIHNRTAISAAAGVADKSALGPDEADFWRSCMYPHDAALHRLVCGSRRR